MDHLKRLRKGEAHVASTMLLCLNLYLSNTRKLRGEFAKAGTA